MARLARPRREGTGPPVSQDSGHGFNFSIPAFAAIVSSDNNPLRDFKPPSLPRFDLPFELTWHTKEVDGHPNKQRLLTVSGFFKYTEQQDKELFKALDRDNDGRVEVSDLKDYLRTKNLPQEYASEFINRARGARWWASSVTYDEFKSLIDDNESKMLKAFCMLDVDASGQLDVSKIKGSLAKLQLPATDDNAKAMLRTVGKAEDASVAYGEFRRFVMMLPGDKLLSEAEPNVMWFESATLVPLGPFPESSRDKGTGALLLRAALAGGLSSGCSTLLMHPLDTLKTRIQSIPGATIGSVVRSVPELGARAMYRGIIPAASGSFTSHGIRTCSYEACLLALGALGVPYMQAQPVASFAGTFVGTLARIPCEVLKQQLQAGRHENVRVACRELKRLDGTKGFFRGAGALLSREVPFYVFGMVIYEQYKRLATGQYTGLRPRKLSNVEYIALGGLAGASASFLTTPADVLKSRLMTAAAGSRLTARQVLVDLLQKEGFTALFKGALPRAVWIAPLGAMNFAGYELAKRAIGAGAPTPEPDTPAGEAATGERTSEGALVAASTPLQQQPAPTDASAPPPPGGGGDSDLASLLHALGSKLQGVQSLWKRGPQGDAASKKSSESPDPVVEQAVRDAKAAGARDCQRSVVLSEAVSTPSSVLMRLPWSQPQQPQQQPNNTPPSPAPSTDVRRNDAIPDAPDTASGPAVNVCKSEDNQTPFPPPLASQTEPPGAVNAPSRDEGEAGDKAAAAEGCSEGGDDRPAWAVGGEWLRQQLQHGRDELSRVVSGTLSKDGRQPPPSPDDPHNAAASAGNDADTHVAVGAAEEQVHVDDGALCDDAGSDAAAVSVNSPPAAQGSDPQGSERQSAASQPVSTAESATSVVEQRGESSDDLRTEGAGDATPPLQKENPKKPSVASKPLLLRFPWQRDPPVPEVTNQSQEPASAESESGQEAAKPQMPSEPLEAEAERPVALQHERRELAPPATHEDAPLPIKTAEALPSATADTERPTADTIASHAGQPPEQADAFSSPAGAAGSGAAALAPEPEAHALTHPHMHDSAPASLAQPELPPPSLPPPSEGGAPLEGERFACGDPGTEAAQFGAGPGSEGREQQRDGAGSDVEGSRSAREETKRAVSAPASAGPYKVWPCITWEWEWPVLRVLANYLSQQ